MLSRSKAKFRTSLVVLIAIFSLSSMMVPVTHAVTPASKLELNPKIGSCYLFSSKELEAPSPLTNPIPCSRTHNAETFWVAKWPLKLAPSRYTEELIKNAAQKVCLAAWEFPEDADLNYWGYFHPSPAQWAKGARWLRCDALIQQSEVGTFNQKYLQWRGNAVLNEGFVVRYA